MDGYLSRGTQPDVGWWLEQIKAGEELRKKQAYQDKWDEWDKMFRAEWRDDQVPVNLFFQMLRSTVPRVYFRNPGVSIAPALPGPEYMLFAKILERIDNKLLRISQVKPQMKMAIQHGFKRGTGIMKTGFSSQFNPAILREALNDGMNKQGARTEYSHATQPGMPWAMSTHPKNIVFPVGASSWADCRWVAEKVIRPINDVREDPRFKNTVGLVAGTGGERYGWEIERPQHIVQLWEVRDLKTGKVMVLAPNKDLRSKNDNQVLLMQDDVLQMNGRLNYHPLIFNPDEERVWGTPDSQVMETYQRELNENRRLLTMHRRISIMKLLAQKGKVSREEVSKMVSEDVLPVVWVSGSPRDAVQTVQAGGIPDDLLKVDEVVRRDTRETLGFSRNQAGEYNPGSSDTTATEAQIVREAMEIRVDERRDIVADALVGIIEDWHQIIFEMWTEEDVIDLVGPGGVQVWVKFSGQLLKQGRYTINVDPDSSVPQTRAVREQRAIRVYEILKQNPIIDPTKLTQYLLHELHGVQFDDMMRMMPNVGQPSEAIDVQQFGQLIQQSAKQISKGAA